MKGLLLAGLLAVLLGPPAFLAAQWSAPPLPAEADPSAVRLFVGATAGSLIGVVAWAYGGGAYNTDVDESLLALAATTTVGSAVGAWLASADTGRQPRFGRLLLGATAGIAAGALLGAVHASLLETPGGPRQGTWIVSYSVGQGIVTAWIGSGRGDGGD